MQIAVVAPSPAPFTIGGAENFWWGLTQAINQHTPHQADLIKLPYRERDCWELVSSYRCFHRLDLDHFDLIISSKYPAWMVFHPKHVCYMQHKLRGLYDTYHLTGLPLSPRISSAPLEDLYRFMKIHQGDPHCLEDFFERFEKLRSVMNDGGKELAFPGPFMRYAIHFLDGIALAPSKVCKYAAISNNVAHRKDYFPNGVDIEVIHHPSNLPEFKSGQYLYFLTIARLDNAKRVDLLIKAMRYVRSNVELFVAGAGPQADELRMLAEHDKRVHFLGFINDSELVELYANALAVLYVPYDEDYGLITIEAMMSAKPVITCIDSGGPNEFILDGQNGFAVPPEPEAIAEKMDYLAQDKELCRTLGVKGKESVRHITWERTVNKLLTFDEKVADSTPKPLPRFRKEKMVVVNTFSVYPPQSGGQNRVFHLYRHLTDLFEIELISLANFDRNAEEQLLVPGLKEIRVPKSEEQAYEEYMQYESMVSVPVSDVAFPFLYKLTPDFISAVAQSCRSADVVVSSHPYVWPVIRETYEGPIWYDAHNVEVELKKGILPDNPVGQKLLKMTRQVEEACCREGKIILTCSMEDKLRLGEIYQADLTKIIVVPNGVDLDSVSFSKLEEREATKRRMGLEGLFIALFIGSWHGPNLEALQHILKTAKRMPEVIFLIIGSACHKLKLNQYPKNVYPLGVVEDSFKDVCLSFVDVALNPITSGSGTNLKILDYMAAGVPVISTKFGIRGYDLVSSEHLILAHEDKLEDAIRFLQHQTREDTVAMVERARQKVWTDFGWEMIAKRLTEELAPMLKRLSSKA